MVDWFVLQFQVNHSGKRAWSDSLWALASSLYLEGSAPFYRPSYWCNLQPCCPGSPESELHILFGTCSTDDESVRLGKISLSGCSCCRRKFQNIEAIAPICTDPSYFWWPGSTAFWIPRDGNWSWARLPYDSALTPLFPPVAQAPHWLACPTGLQVPRGSACRYL